MPNCFQLTRKGYPSPAVLQTVDAELCQHLDLPFSDRSWTCGWYDDIGFSIACGATLPSLIDQYRTNAERNDAFRTHDLIMWRVAAYLNEHYTTDAWAEIGR